MNTYRIHVPANYDCCSRNIPFAYLLKGILLIIFLSWGNININIAIETAGHDYDIIAELDNDMLLGGITENKSEGDEPDIIAQVFLLRSHRKPQLIKRQQDYMIDEIQVLKPSSGRRLLLLGFRSPHRSEHYLPVVFSVSAGQVPIFSELRFPDRNLPPMLYAGKARLIEQEYPTIELFEALVQHNAAPPFAYLIQKFQLKDGRLHNVLTDKLQFTKAESFSQQANIGAHLAQQKLYPQAINAYLKAFLALRKEVYPISTELRNEVRFSLAKCYLQTEQKAQAEALLKAIIASEQGESSPLAQEARGLLHN